MKIAGLACLIVLAHLVPACTNAGSSDSENTKTPESTFETHVKSALLEDIDTMVPLYDPAGVYVLSHTGIYVRTMPIDEVRSALQEIFDRCDFSLEMYEDIVLGSVVVEEGYFIDDAHSRPSDVLVSAAAPAEIGSCEGAGYHLDGSWTCVMREISPDNWRIKATFDGFGL